MPLWNDQPEAWHEVLPGVQRRILSHGSSAMLVLYRIAPGSEFPRHTHPHAQYGTFLEGGGIFRVGGEEWSVKAGDSYYVLPNVPHQLTADPKISTVVLDVFTPEREDFLAEALPANRL